MLIKFASTQHSFEILQGIERQVGYMRVYIYKERANILFALLTKLLQAARVTICTVKRQVETRSQGLITLINYSSSALCPKAVASLLLKGIERLSYREYL